MTKLGPTSHNKRPIYQISIILIGWNLISFPWGYTLMESFLDTFANILGGNIVILIYWLIPPVLEKKVNDAYKLCLVELTDKSKTEEYIKDTEPWLNKIFKNKEIPHKFLKLILFFGIIGSIVFSYLILNINQIDFDFQNNGPQGGFSNYFEEIKNYSQGELINFLIMYLLNMVGQYYVIYLLIYSIYLSIGSTYIFHHFTFWDTVPQDTKTSNPVGEAIILNSFFFIIQLSSSMFSMFGFMLCGLIYVFSPLNPTKNYTQGISVNYRKLKNSIPFLFLLKILLDLQLNPGNIFSTSINNLLLESFMIIAFYIFFKKVLNGTTKINEINHFNNQLAFKRIFNGDSQKKLQTFDFLIFLTPLSVLIFGLIFKLIGFQFTLEFFKILVSAFLLMLVMLILSKGLIKIHEYTKNIGESLFDFNKQDKKGELTFHFWETFSSKQIIIFCIPFIIIFVDFGVSMVFETILSFNYLGIFSGIILIIPFIISFSIIGFLFGSLIWSAYHAPHFSWHAITLLDTSKFNKKTILKKFNISMAYKQENLIYFTIMIGLLGIVLIFGVLGGISFYNFIPMLFFPLIILSIFNIKIKKIFKNSFEEIFSQI